MKHAARNSTLLVACSILSLLAAGCGSNVKVKGKVVKGGNPIQVSDKGRVVVIFTPGADVKDVPAGTNFSGDVGADGSFEVKGPEGKGIPKGKYKITVHTADPFPMGNPID